MGNEIYNNTIISSYSPVMANSNKSVNNSETIDKYITDNQSRLRSQGLDLAKVRLFLLNNVQSKDALTDTQIQFALNVMMIFGDDAKVGFNDKDDVRPKVTVKLEGFDKPVISDYVGTDEVSQTTLKLIQTLIDAYRKINNEIVKAFDETDEDIAKKEAMKKAFIKKLDKKLSETIETVKMSLKSNISKVNLSTAQIETAKAIINDLCASFSVKAEVGIMDGSIATETKISVEVEKFFVKVNTAVSDIKSEANLKPSQTTPEDQKLLDSILKYKLAILF